MIADWLGQIAQINWFAADFPIPPSTNHYWRHTAKGVFLSSAAKRYRVKVAAKVLTERIPRFSCPVIAAIELHPNHVRCDTDNYEKAFWDALQHAGVLYNDCQVMCVLRYWGERRKQRGLTLRIAAVTDTDILNRLPAWADQSVISLGQSAAKVPKHGGTGAKNAKRKPRSKSRIVYRGLGAKSRAGDDQ